MYLEAPCLQADGISTYGQPRTCDRLLAASCNKGFKNRLQLRRQQRHVPQLPPEPACTHLETLHYIDASGRVRSSPIEALRRRPGEEPRLRRLRAVLPGGVVDRRGWGHGILPAGVVDGWDLRGAARG
jgi:hypothetical protein